jgi:hypothetical protein
MFFVLGILIGIAAGVGFHYRRAIEMKRAIDARNYLLAVADRKVDILAREVVRRDVTIANIRAMAIRVHGERVLNLGGSVSLPGPARLTRQISTDRVEMENHSAGPPFDGPRFLGR